MPFLATLSAISSSAPLASRAFMPLLIVCILANPSCHEYLPEMIQINPPENMLWLVSTQALVIIGILSLLEICADKNNELKELMDGVQTWVKTIIAILVGMMIIPEVTEELVAPELDRAGFISWKTSAIFVTALLTFFLSSMRVRFFRFWGEMDDDDIFHIRRIVSYFEDLWAFLAIPVVIAMPILAIIISAIFLAIALLYQRLLHYLDDRERITCGSCQTEIKPSASVCHQCDADHIPQKLLNWKIFRSKQDNVEALSPELEEKHQLRLLSSRCCPNCAERIEIDKYLKEGCMKCCQKLDPEFNPDWFNKYKSEVIARAWKFIIPCTILSLIPVLGFAVSIVVIKLYIVAPLRIFLGMRMKFTLRWGMRLLTLLLLIPACIPVVSLLVVPILLAVHILVYSRYAEKRIGKLAPELLRSTAIEIT
ncbi:MAG: DUF4126 domain-containing protein [Lentisphaeria bacterium]|nr:DUF4126 domain-containing protein [Lentisphaeria bacterium]